MEKKNAFGDKLEAFFAGKGFAIVLLLCAAVIGVSAWMLFAEMGTEAADTTIQPAAAENEAQEFVYEISVPVSETEAPSQPEAAEAAETEEAEELPVWTETESTETMQETPSMIWPLVGEIENAYSMEALHYNRTMDDWRTHDGVDIAAELGTQVMAIGSGRVTAVWADDMLGTTVEIEHSGGLKSRYCNLAELPTVTVGDSVVTGEVIGAVGDTALGETAEVSHLHLAMTLDGASVNPADYLPAR